MDRKTYFDSPQEEEREVKKSLTLLENVNEERFDINHRVIRMKSMIILIQRGSNAPYFSHP